MTSPNYPGIDERIKLIRARYPFVTRNQAHVMAAVAIRPESHNDAALVGFDARERPVFANDLTHQALRVLLNKKRLQFAVCKNGKPADAKEPVRRVPVLGHPFHSTQDDKRPWTVRIIQPNNEVHLARFVDKAQAEHFILYYGHPTEPSTSEQLSPGQAEPSFRKVRTAA